MILENILIFTTTLLAAFLLFNEFYTYHIVKPTQTSMEQSLLKKEYFPVMIVCPEPAFNITALKEEEYRLLYSLWTGNTDHTFHGNLSNNTSLNNFWGGKKNISQSKLL